MLDHVTLGVADFDRSVAFYDRALAPLGLSRLYTVPPELTGGVMSTGYGDTRPFFWIAGQDATHGKLHLAFRAADREQVDTFHVAALAANDVGVGNGGHVAQRGKKGSGVVHAGSSGRGSSMGFGGCKEHACA